MDRAHIASAATGTQIGVSEMKKIKDLSSDEDYKSLLYDLTNALLIFLKDEKKYLDALPTVERGAATSKRFTVSNLIRDLQRRV